MFLLQGRDFELRAIMTSIAGARLRHAELLGYVGPDGGWPDGR
jgi:hypothetical protein